MLGSILKFTDIIGGLANFLAEKGPPLLDSAKGVFTELKEVANDATQGRKDLGTIVTSGQNLLESINKLKQSLKSTVTEGVNIIQSDTESNIDTTAATSYLGAELASNLYHKVNGDRDKIARLERLVKEGEENVKDAQNRKKLIEQSFIPVVETMATSLEWMISDLQGKSESSSVRASETGIRKWQLSRILKDVKGELEMLSNGVETRAFVSALDRVQDSITMQIDLIEDIGKYEETIKLSGYVAALNAANLKSIQVGDPALSTAVTKMEKSIVSNAFKMDYQRALHAFKQWVFPFAKIHLTTDLELKKGTWDTSGDAFLKRMETIQAQWDRYKGATVSAHDTHLIHTDFSSSHTSSSPFFVWKNEEWSQDITDLLAGRPIHLKADVKLSQKDRDAVKFKQIEISFKILSQQEDQQSLISELAHFGVIMTHSGLSHYRYQGKFYVMNGATQTIRYNFERDRVTGNRLGTNRVYEKFNKGDFLLSPYSLWTIQLIKTSPGDAGIDFQNLTRFAPHIDLELVGTGIYVDGERMKGMDMEVEKYYTRDESVRAEIDF